jgi:hypothetical protein
MVKNIAGKGVVAKAKSGSAANIINLKTSHQNKQVRNGIG